MKKNAWLQEQIQSYLKLSQSGQMVIDNLNLKLLRNFPDVTIELKNIKYYEHPDSLRMSDEKPILSAERLYVAFELIPLLDNELKITAINLSGAQINIIEYSNGRLNINNALTRPSTVKIVPPIVKKDSSKNSLSPPKAQKLNKPKTAIHQRTPLQINLKDLEFSEIQLSWKSKFRTDVDSILIKNLDVEVNTNGKNLIALARSIYIIQNINSFPVPSGQLTLNTIINYNTQSKLAEIKQCEIIYDVIKAFASGSYSFSDNQKLNISIAAFSNDLTFLSSFFKPGLIKQNSELLNRGSIYLKGKIYGELKNQSPQFDFIFGLKNLNLRLPGELGSFKDIGFDGKISSGVVKDLSKAHLEINNLRGLLPGGYIKGKFKVSNFKDPYLNYNLNASLNLKGYDQVFRMDFISELKGTLNLWAKFNGRPKQIATHEMDKKRSSLITFNGVSFKLTKTKQLIRDLSGKLETINNESTLKEVQFKYGQDDVRINATMDNLLFLVFSNEKPLNLSGNIFSKQIYTKDLILDSAGNAQVKDRLSDLSFDFKLMRITNSEDSSASGFVNFDIRNLKFNLDELSDVRNIDMSGKFGNTTGGFKLELNSFNALMPYGKIDLQGDMLIPEKRTIEFDAKIKMNDFPWTYVNDLINEINDGKEPSSKNLPLEKMEIITADLDLSSTIITYPFDIKNLSIRNSKAQIKFPGAKIVSAVKIDLSVDSLYFIHPNNSGSITGVKSASGKINLKELKIPELNSFDIQLDVNGKNDNVNFIFSRVAKLSKNEIGKFLLDISKKEPVYKLHYDVKGADLAYFIKKLKKGELMKGRIDYTLDLNSNGTDWTKIKKNISGTIAIKGDSLLLSGVDIDDLISKFKQSQNFNLTDVGAVLIAGPVGLAVTKGQDFVSLARINFDSKSSTLIRVLNSKWRLENRVLISEDVAISTNLNRIALDGRIDFANDSIPGINIAVVDKYGCSLMHQKLYGKFNSLQTGKLNMAKTIFGSVINSVNSVVGKDCVPVYTGIVKNPGK